MLVPPGRRLFTATMACGDMNHAPGGTPSPTTFEVCLVWQEVRGSAACKTAQNAREVFEDLARQFEAAAQAPEKCCAGVYSSHVALLADSAPPKFGATEFVWIEPCYRPPNEPTQSLADAIVEQCEQLVA